MPADFVASENSTGKNKDQLSRDRGNKCKNRVGDLVYEIVGDQSYSGSKWNKRIMLVEKAIEKIHDPQFMLERLRVLIQPNIENSSSVCDLKKVESAFQEIDSFLQRPNNTFLNQDPANKIYESPPNSFQLNQDEILQIEAEASQNAKELQASSEELNQILARQEPMLLSIREAKFFTSIARSLQNVVKTCSTIAESGILSKGCGYLDQGHHAVSFEIEGGKLRVNLPLTSDTIQIEQEGNFAEVNNKEIIIQEKDGNEVTLNVGLVEGRAAELKLAMKVINQEMGYLVDWNNDDQIDISDLLFDSEFFSNSEMDETCTIEDCVVSKSDFGVVDEIRQMDSNFAKNFRFINPDLQRYVMRVLAKLYKEMKSKLEDLELEDNKQQKLKEDIEFFESTIKELEFCGLQLSLLKKMLKELPERFERQVETNKWREVIKSSRAKAEKAEEEAKKAEQMKKEAEEKAKNANQEKRQAQQEVEEAQEQLAKLNKKQRIQ